MTQGLQNHVPDSAAGEIITASLPWRVRLLRRPLMRLRPAPVAAWCKRVAGIRRIDLETPAGRLSVDPVSVMGDALMTSGAYEPGMVEVLRSRLPAGGTFVDLGANEGFFSVLACRLVGASGRVLAIEPQSRLQAVIQRNAAMNDLRNLALVRVAITDQAGSSVLHLTASMNTGSSGLSRQTSYALPTEPVQTRTLASVLAENGIEEVDLLKVDIEGYEYEAVLGSQELFRSGRITAIALEIHPTILKARGKRQEEITGFLSACGYTCDGSYGPLLLVLR